MIQGSQNQIIMALSKNIVIIMTQQTVQLMVDYINGMKRCSIVTTQGTQGICPHGWHIPTLTRV